MKYLSVFALTYLLSGCTQQTETKQGTSPALPPQSVQKEVPFRLKHAVNPGYYIAAAYAVAKTSKEKQFACEFDSLATNYGCVIERADEEKDPESIAMENRTVEAYIIKNKDTLGGMMLAQDVYLVNEEHRKRTGEIAVVENNITLACFKKDKPMIMTIVSYTDATTGKQKSDIKHNLDY